MNYVKWESCGGSRQRQGEFWQTKEPQQVKHPSDEGCFTKFYLFSCL